LLLDSTAWERQEAMERRLAAILAADVVGYSRLMAANETGTHARLGATRREVLNPLIAAHNGRIVKLIGDGALVEFPSVIDAVTCAVAMQAGVAERQVGVPDDQRIQFRIGINIGDVIIDEGDIYGDGVNVAARLEPLAEPGGVCVSRTVVEYTKGKLDLHFEPMGEHRLKNIPESIRVYRVVPGSGPQGHSKRRGLAARWMAIGAVAIVVSGLALWLQPWQLLTPPPVRQTDVVSPSRLSVAVLPFDNLSSDKEDEYFADGLTDDLITDLSKISALFVIARNSVFSYKGSAVDTRTIASELGVRYILEGSVRRAGDQLRINAQLIDSETGGHLWAERFDRSPSDIFAVQDDVIRQVVDALDIDLSTSEKERLTRLPTKNLEAYDYFLRAEQVARIGSGPELREALRLYERAMALDGNFAEAFAADARTAAYTMRNNFDHVLPGPVARKRAYEHASKALEINPDAPLPFSVLAVLQVVDARHQEALASAQRAVTLGPSDAEAYAALSLVLTFSGRHADAVAAIETALRLNPNMPTTDRIVAGLALLLNDDPERAIEVLEHARAESPNLDEAHVMLTAAYVAAGRTKDANRAAAEALRLSPNLCIELYRVVLSHFRSSQDLAKILAALKAGGLPEWPHGFSAAPGNRMAAAEVGRLAFGRTWQGRLEGGGPALSQIERDGTLAFRTTNYIATGRAFIAGDTLCEQVEALSLGRPVCGPVYRRSNPSGEDTLPYTYVNATKVFHFATAE
jgi:adenylate cyclase